MALTPPGLWLVQTVSVSRLLAALIFASIALQDFPLPVVGGLYLVAACSDILDGYLARKLNSATFVGRVVDLISDKSLTIVSLLYAAARGVPLLPLALLATREVVVLGLRIIVVQGTQLLPTSRLFGGVMATCLWGNTLFLLIAGTNKQLFQVAVIVYWLCALILVVNLGARLMASSDRIRSALRADL